MSQPRFLPARLALILAAIALCEGLTACWITGALGSWLPLSGMIPLSSLPHILCGLTIALAALATPFLVGNSSDRPRLTLFQALFAALWQSGMFCFFLMVCGRLSPLQPGGIALAAMWAAAFAFCCLMLCELAPRAYSGVMFFWVIAMPMVGYFTADVFADKASSNGWQPYEANSSVYAFVHALLNFSPGTATAAALDGALPDGNSAAPWPGLIAVGILAALLALLNYRRALSPDSSAIGVAHNAISTAEKGFV